MRVIVLLCAFIAVGAVNAAAQDQALVEKGMKVYADQKCGICHSIDGKGNAKGSLDGTGIKLTADQVREWMVNPLEMHKKMKAERKPFMKAYPNLPKDELDAIVAYMMSLKKK